MAVGDGNTSHCENRSLNGEEWFCMVWKGVRKGDGDDMGGDTRRGEGRQGGAESP